MEIKGWKYYANMLMPACAPEEKPDIAIIKDKRKWPQKALLARYTTDFDCKEETQWWYCIKDEPVNLDSMKAKKRYEISRGLKNYEVRKINPVEYKDELCQCYLKSCERYEKDSKDSEYKRNFIQGLGKGKNSEYYAAFHRETGEMAAYALNIVYDTWVNFAVAKFVPEHMKERVSAAVIYTILYDYINVQGKKYVSDGERTVFHDTNIQDYLESLFGFRKAYCRLNIVYRFPIKVAVKILFPFRKLFEKKNRGIAAKIRLVLKLEEISRKG